MWKKDGIIKKEKRGDVKHMRFLAYHGTDRERAEKILAGAFRVKANDEHWLGNGVYFYLDSSLARWWTTRPTRKFGEDVHTRAVLECILEPPGRILDLRKLDDYRWFVEEYAQVIDYLTEKTHVERSSFKKLRCAFCDYLYKQYRFDLIVGTFHLPEQPYLDFPRTPDFNQLQLSYVETQVCVFNQAAIISKRLMEKE